MIFCYICTQEDEKLKTWDTVHNDYYNNLYLSVQNTTVK
jgi:hypothetical protein